MSEQRKKFIKGGKREKWTASEQGGGLEKGWEIRLGVDAQHEELFFPW